MSVIRLLKKMQFAMILFLCFACFSNSLSAAPQKIVSKKELDVALKSAKTQEGRQRIATYYQEQAKKLEVKENEERVWRITTSRTPACTASNILHPTRITRVSQTITTRLRLGRSKRLTNS